MAKILVVDDHPHIVRLLLRELTAEGHAVLTAGTGEEALRKIREELPELVVLDVTLPGKDGLTVLQELRADPVTQGTAVILLTARDQPGEVTDGLQWGADWYMTKPFYPGEIATVVRRLLESPPTLTAPCHQEGRLPTTEIDLLTMTAAAAFDLALRGEVDEGYSCLSIGLQRADTARAVGRPWARELALRYQEFRDHYVARYGQRSCEAVPIVR